MPRSKLEALVSRKLMFCLSGVTIKENTRPDWLISNHGERLELDFYIPELDLAIEVQGAQHYKFTPHFHKGQRTFADQVRRDREKRAICDRKGITLFEIASEVDLESFASKINNMIPEIETNEEFINRMKEYNGLRPKRIIPNWQRTKKIKRLKAKNFRKFKTRLLRTVKIARILNKKILVVREQLLLIDNQALIDSKSQKLANMEAALEGNINKIKKLARNQSLEIRIAFLISKEHATKEDIQCLIKMYRQHKEYGISFNSFFEGAK